jgi:Cu/Ag efflux pump CusA
LIDRGGADDVTKGFRVEDVENVVLIQSGGLPIQVRDIAKVSVGYVPRLGIAGRDKEDDVVTAIVVMGRTQHTNDIIPRVQAEVAKLNSDGSLPPGVKVVPYYDRSSLVGVTTRTVLHNLVFGCLLVFLIQWVFLGDLRSAVIVGANIPFALFFAVIILVLRDGRNDKSAGRRRPRNISRARQPNLNIRVDREKAARYGLNTGDVNTVVQAALGGTNATTVLEGDRQFSLAVRLDPKFRQSIETIRTVKVAYSTPSGTNAYIPLSELADISLDTGASFIYRERSQRYIPVKFRAAHAADVDDGALRRRRIVSGGALARDRQPGAASVGDGGGGRHVHRTHPAAGRCACAAKIFLSREAQPEAEPASGLTQ